MNLNAIDNETSQHHDTYVYFSNIEDDNDICELCGESFEMHDVDLNYDLHY